MGKKEHLLLTSHPQQLPTATTCHRDESITDQEDDEKFDIDISDDEDEIEADVHDD